MKVRTEGLRKSIIRMAAAVLALLFAFLPAAAEETFPGISAAQYCFGMESRHHVSILMGDECRSEQPEGFRLLVIPRSPSLFLWLYSGEEQYAEILRVLDRALSAYPDGFFRNFRSEAGESRLKFLIGDRIEQNGRTFDSVTVSDTEGHSTVCLAADPAGTEAAAHRAIWYALEARILFKHPLAFRDWKNLNPRDFSYSREGTADAGASGPEEEEWFVNEQSKVSETEDRAAVFEAWMTRDDAWWAARPRLKEKARFLLQKIQSVIKMPFRKRTVSIAGAPAEARFTADFRTAGKSNMP